MTAPPSIFWKGGGRRGGGGNAVGAEVGLRVPAAQPSDIYNCFFTSAKNPSSVPALYICILSLLPLGPSLHVWFVVSLCLNCNCFRAAIMSPLVSWQEIGWLKTTHLQLSCLRLLQRMNNLMPLKSFSNGKSISQHCCEFEVCQSQILFNN